MIAAEIATAVDAAVQYAAERAVSTDQAFLRKIHENPADHLPQLVYADHLDESGRGDEADALRREIQGEPLPPPTGRYTTDRTLRHLATAHPLPLIRAAAKLKNRKLLLDALAESPAPLDRSTGLFLSPSPEEDALRGEWHDLATRQSRSRVARERLRQVQALVNHIDMPSQGYASVYAKLLGGRIHYFDTGTQPPRLVATARPNNADERNAAEDAIYALEHNALYAGDDALEDLLPRRDDVQP